MQSLWWQFRCSASKVMRLQAKSQRRMVGVATVQVICIWLFASDIAQAETSDRCSPVVEITAPRYLELRPATDCELSLTQLSDMINMVTEVQKTEVKFLTFYLEHFRTDVLRAVPSYKSWQLPLIASKEELIAALIEQLETHIVIPYAPELQGRCAMKTWINNPMFVNVDLRGMYPPDPKLLSENAKVWFGAVRVLYAPPIESRCLTTKKGAQ